MANAPHSRKQYEDPKWVWKYLTREMEQAVSDRNHPFHVIQVATIRENAPELRAVVLRDVNLKQRYLSFHSDWRSPKVRDLQHNPATSVLLYDRESGFQMRIRATAVLHHKDRWAELRWSQTRPFSRKCYYIETPPGSLSEIPESGLPERLLETNPTEIESAEGFENFTVVENQFDTIEWLQLHSELHIRGLFSWTGKRWEHQWLIP